MHLSICIPLLPLPLHLISISIFIPSLHNALSLSMHPNPQTLNPNSHRLTHLLVAHANQAQCRTRPADQSDTSLPTARRVRRATWAIPDFANDRAPLVQRPCSTTLRTKLPHAAAEHRDICVPLLFDAVSGPSHCIALARPSMQSSFSRTSLLFPSQAINHRSPRKSSLHGTVCLICTVSSIINVLRTRAALPDPVFLSPHPRTELMNRISVQSTPVIPRWTRDPRYNSGTAAAVQIAPLD